MDWTADAIARLRSLWDEGLSTAEIGRRLNISKNSVVGKAHRLDLPARPSPIRRGVDAVVPEREAAPRRISGSTLPSMASERSQPAAPSRAASPQVSNVTVLNRPSLVAAMAAPARPVSRLPACCWPIGEPGTPSFRFCGDLALANKPYCGPHAEIAYVRVRDRREDVA